MDENNERASWNISQYKIQHIAELINMANHYELGTHYTSTEGRPAGWSDFSQSFKCWKLISAEINNLYTPDEIKEELRLRTDVLKKSKRKNPDYKKFGTQKPKYILGRLEVGRNMQPYKNFVNKMLKVHGYDVPIVDTSRGEF